MTENTVSQQRQSPADVHIPQIMTMAPVPCRMIYIQVHQYSLEEHEDGSLEIYEKTGKIGGFYVTWVEVIGCLCIAETRYLHTSNTKSPKPGATHEEMMEAGWRTDHPNNWIPLVWPVVAGSNDPFDYPLRVLHERHGNMGAEYSTVVPAQWPQCEDKENAIRIGMSLVVTQRILPNWTLFLLWSRTPVWSPELVRLSTGDLYELSSADAYPRNVRYDASEWPAWVPVQQPARPQSRTIWPAVLRRFDIL